MAAAPFRADHVGSLLRPAALHELREQVRKKEISLEKLKDAEDRHIREVVKLQEDAGLQSITDGEFRRSWWHFLRFCAIAKKNRLRRPRSRSVC